MKLPLFIKRLMCDHVFIPGRGYHEVCMHCGLDLGRDAINTNNKDK